MSAASVLELTTVQNEAHELRFIQAGNGRASTMAEPVDQDQPQPQPAHEQPQPQPQPAPFPPQSQPASVSLQPAQVFHERHRCRDLCLLHSLNNLYQSKTFTHHELNNIAHNLPPELQSGQHGIFACSFFNNGTRNYNINVLQRALQTRGAVIHAYLDLGANSFNLDEALLKGFILKRGGGAFRHWAAVKKVNTVWMDLDSHIAAPAILGNDDALRAFLLQKIESGSKVVCVWDTQQV
ncbi:hypothetical protein L7F22_007112 [Adiantum nelumboides]|nr:hypothetical protein [Adiantum nelumboides]